MSAEYEYQLSRVISQIEMLIQVRLFLEKHRDDIERIGLKPDAYMPGRLDFNMPTRDQVIAAFTAVGGKWEKTPTEGGTINYERADGLLMIRLYAAEPPPTCKIVEEEVWVEQSVTPGHMEKRRKLVCIEETA